MRLFHTLIFIAASAAATALVPQGANAEKVCKEVCAAGVCRQECVETEGRRDRLEDRREERRDVIIDKREERREPGIELRVPAPEIRVAPPGR